MNIRVLLMLALVIGSLIMPVMAGEKYLYGYPEFSASIAGTNEFVPGEMVTLTVMLENQGLNTVKVVLPSLISREDLPNLAKMVRVALTPGDSPVEVKSDSQMVGDIPGGASIPASFLMKIDEDATPGTYILPLDLSYTYLNYAEQTSAETVVYYYRTKETTVPVLVAIKADLSLEVVDFSTESLNVGTEGYLTLQVKNAGHEYGRASVVRIAQNGNSPLVPTDDSVYIGDFAPGSVQEVSFKVAVSDEAEEQVYPIEVFAEFENEDGLTVESDGMTIGVPVGGKIDFTVVSDAAEILPGEKRVIEVIFRNTGAASVYGAQARVSAVDPFSSNDDTAYLGDIGPGESATARFEISADDTATIKLYGLDSEIRYRDALDNSQISDTMKIPVEVTPKSGTSTFLSNPLVLSVLVVALLGAGYYVMKNRKKS